MLRSRAGEILFMDLRTWTENPVKNESKKKVLLSSEQIQKAADIYHTWQSEGTDGANYAVPELYRSVSKDEIEKQGWSLVPSKYIEFIDHDLEIDYAAEMSRIQKEMREVLKQEMKSQKMLEDAFRGLGMALNNYKLGDLIELNSEENKDLIYGISDVRGVNNTKTNFKH